LPQKCDPVTMCSRNPIFWVWRAQHLHTAHFLHDYDNAHWSWTALFERLFYFAQAHFDLVIEWKNRVMLSSCSACTLENCKIIVGQCWWALRFVNKAPFMNAM
jgi:hypothetical protein